MTLARSELVLWSILRANVLTFLDGANTHSMVRGISLSQPEEARQATHSLWDLLFHGSPSALCLTVAGVARRAQATCPEKCVADVLRAAMKQTTCIHLRSCTGIRARCRKLNNTQPSLVPRPYSSGTGSGDATCR